MRADGRLTLQIVVPHHGWEWCQSAWTAAAPLLVVSTVYFAVPVLMQRSISRSTTNALSLLTWLACLPHAPVGGSEREEVEEGERASAAPRCDRLRHLRPEGLKALLLVRSLVCPHHPGTHPFHPSTSSHASTMTSVSCVCRTVSSQRASLLVARSSLVRRASSTAEASTSSEASSPQISPEAAEDAQDDASSSTSPAGSGGGRGRDSKKLSLSSWLKSQEGLSFKRPAAGRTNWIGRTVSREIAARFVSFASEPYSILVVVCATFRARRDAHQLGRILLVLFLPSCFGGPPSQSILLILSPPPALLYRTDRSHMQPFPLNPSFRPPTPLSDAHKTRIYRSFVDAVKSQSEQSSTSSSKSTSSSSSASKSETYFVRKLAMQYNLSMDRIRAIVRLKALEENMQSQGKEIQGKFLAGMEEALGVRSGDVGQVYVQGLKEPVAGMVQETKEAFAMGKKSSWIMVDEEAPEDSIGATASARSAAAPSKRQTLGTPKPSSPSSSTNQPRTVKTNESSRRNLVFVDVPTTRKQDSTSR